MAHAGTARPFAAHIREHGSLLAPLEKEILIRIAERLPSWINSDHLSALSLGAMAGAGASFAAFRWTPWAALGVGAALAANWFGDSLDGTLARVRGHERPRYGFYVDHVIDVGGATLLLTGLASSGLTHPLAAMALLVAFLLAASEAYLATYASGIFRLSFLRVGPTELRIGLAAAAIRCAVNPTVTIAGSTFLLFDVATVLGAAGLLGAFVWAAINNGRALYREEPRRRV